MPPEIVRHEAGGVPVYALETPDIATAVLFFRVGRGDETAPTSGITHLVEHLALFPFGQRPYAYNGQSDSLFTTFFVSADADTVRRHIEDLCRHLSSLPVDRLAMEAGILRDEAKQRVPAPQDHHAWLRWGLHGHGLTFIRELGLSRVGEDEVARWSQEWFTAGNVAVVWTGPAFQGLELPLPAGEPKLPVRPKGRVTAPIWAFGAPDGVSASFVGSRTSAFAVGQRVLTNRLQQRLRYDQGLSYTVAMAYEPLSADFALSTIWATAPTDRAEAVRNTFVQAIEEARSTPPTATELEVDLDAARGTRQHPLAKLGEANRLAVQTLLRARPQTLDEIDEEQSVLAPQDVHTTFRACSERVVLLQPPSVDRPPSNFEVLPNPIPGWFGGRVYFDVRESPFRAGSPQYRRLVVSTQGVSQIDPGGASWRIPYSECAVALRASKALVVVHDSGVEIAIDADTIRDGDRAISVVEKALPPQRLVREFDAPAVRVPVRRPRYYGITVWAWIIGVFMALMGLAALLSPDAAFQPGNETARFLGWAAAICVVAGALLLPIFVYGSVRFRSWAWLAGEWCGAFLLAGSLFWVWAGGPIVFLVFFVPVGLASVYYRAVARRRQLLSPAVGIQSLVSGIRALLFAR